MGKFIIFIANRIWLIAAIYIVSVILAASLFSVIENKTFAEGVWLSVVTSLTIGYGDIFPTTYCGKILISLFGLFWIFAVIPMIIANILVRAIKDANEFTDQEQKEIMSLLREIRENQKERK